MSLLEAPGPSSTRKASGIGSIVTAPSPTAASILTSHSLLLTSLPPLPRTPGCPWALSASSSSPSHLQICGELSSANCPLPQRHRLTASEDYNRGILGGPLCGPPHSSSPSLQSHLSHHANLEFPGLPLRPHLDIHPYYETEAPDPPLHPVRNYGVAGSAH